MHSNKIDQCLKVDLNVEIRFNLCTVINKKKLINFKTIDVARWPKTLNLASNEVLNFSKTGCGPLLRT